MSIVRRFTPEATVGPFFPGSFVADAPQDLWSVAPLVAHRPQGQPIVLAVRFLDASNRPVPSVVVEFWQANAAGRYRHPEDRSSAPLDPQFDGFARLRTDDEGRLRFRTIKPGPHPVPGPSVGASGFSRTFRAPHLRLTIFASGIDRLVTQIFFEEEALNATDPVLASIPDSDVRARLIARRTAGADGVVEYAIDVVMRGDQETPFFDDWSRPSFEPDRDVAAHPSDEGRDWR
jgi:protocatechuate 3,4-dioxygenase beta subunit